MSEGILADLDDVPALASLSTVPRLRFCLARDADAPARWQPWAPLFAAAQRDATVETMDFDEQAFQPYTAGSTGTPKGIILTHGGMLWGIEHSETYWPRRAGERGIVAAPMFHHQADASGRVLGRHHAQLQAARISRSGQPLSRDDLRRRPGDVRRHPAGGGSDRIG
jgi:acyl-coenzyme A synthetase/AMP-(fatty) acid ligase